MTHTTTVTTARALAADTARAAAERIVARDHEYASQIILDGRYEDLVVLDDTLTHAVAYWDGDAAVMAIVWYRPEGGTEDDDDWMTCSAVISTDDAEWLQQISGALT